MKLKLLLQLGSSSTQHVRGEEAHRRTIVSHHAIQVNGSFMEEKQL